MTDRTEYVDGQLDEVVCDGGAHLEHLAGKLWFLSMMHADGTETCLWFVAEKHPRVEKRGNPAESGGT